MSFIFVTVARLSVRMSLRPYLPLPPQALLPLLQAVQDLQSTADSLSNSLPFDLPPRDTYDLIRQKVCLLGFPLAMAANLHFIPRSGPFQDLQQAHPLH